MADVLGDALDLVSSLRATEVPEEKEDRLIEVDPNFVEDPKTAAMVEFGIKRHKNVLLVGPTGCGKSSLAINVAARLGKRLDIINLDGETSVDNLMAKLLISKSDTGSPITSVAYGPVLRAYRDGHGLLLEEVDMAIPDILAALHRVLEINSKFVEISVGDTEVIKKHWDFFVIATANTIGTGEDAFLYAGTKVLNKAFMNRFSLTDRMNYLEKSKEVKVVVAKTGIDRDLAMDMVDAANDARKATKEGTSRVVDTISTRDLLEWADAILGMKLTPMEAAHYTFLNRVSTTDYDIIKGFVENRIK